MRRRPLESKMQVPSYIVTFSDMITLLLTFFVMLLSMADTQVDKHKFMKGHYSFKEAVAEAVLPMTTSGRQCPKPSL